MKKPQRRLYSLACLFPFILGAALSGFVRADPPPVLKSTGSTFKKSEIPLSVLKDIKRIHPGMTRADLDWLFTPDGGFYVVTPRSFIYRYAGASIAIIDAAGKPVLDKITHKPALLGQAIKIDVTFRPATGRDWAMLTEEKTGLHYISSDGSPDDVIVSVSDPYVGFENDT